MKYVPVKVPDLSPGDVVFIRARVTRVAPNAPSGWPLELEIPDSMHSPYPHVVNVRDDGLVHVLKEDR